MSKQNDVAAGIVFVGVAGFAFAGIAFLMCNPIAVTAGLITGVGLVLSGFILAK